MFDWSQIDSVFLDMDGTLLDLHFDNHFWLHYVPQCYAEKNGLSYEQAHTECIGRYRAIQGTLNWYCVDHWTEELGLDIALLKAEVDHLIEVLPHVTDFLNLLEKAGKRRVLVTNAHQKSLALKMEKTRLHHCLDNLISSHDIGVAKEHPDFWPKLQQQEPFDKHRTLFVDDSLSVLSAAQDYGFQHLLAIRYPDRKQAIRDIDGFPAVIEFDVLLPSLENYVKDCSVTPA
jgi:HAD superfamily hydrolase (TIGR01509 family)